MIDPEKFSQMTAANAPSGSLMLPLQPYSYMLLVLGSDDDRIGIILSEDHKFAAIPCTGNTHFKGLVIDDIRLEADHRTAFDPAEGPRKAGVIVRRADGLGIYSTPQDRYNEGRITPVMFKSGLDPVEKGFEVAYSRWQIVYGLGRDKIVLHSVEVNRG